MILLLISLFACEPASTDGPVVLEPRTRSELVFRDPETCRECHPDHVADWEGSMHAYAVVDPIFHALARKQALDFQFEGGQFCTQCHTVPGFLSGETPYYLDENGLWDQKTEDLSTVSGHGVSCDVCHSITNILEPINARIELQPDGTTRGPIADPVDNDFHASMESPLHRSGELCTGCHNVGVPFADSPLVVERTGQEWQEYIEAGGTESCQDCHMPAREDVAAVDGPTRTVHAHTFVGVDVSLVEGFPDMERQRRLVQEMLESSVDLGVAVDEPNASVEVSLTNLAGHHVPSGSTSERRMWVHIQVQDEQGRTVYESGHVDAAGNLQDGFPDGAKYLCTGEAAELEEPGDPDLWWFGAYIVGFCDELSLFPHQANAPVIDHTLPTLTTEQHTYDLGSLPSGSYTVSVDVLFRAFQNHLVDALVDDPFIDLDPAIRDRIPTFTVATHSDTLVVP